MKLCIYTALFGKYENLNEQETSKNSSIDYICFTDDPELKSETWKIKLVEPEFLEDPVRSQRRIKLLAHLYVSEYDSSIYIDNTVILKKNPEDFYYRYMSDNDVAIPFHSFRESVRDEFEAVLAIGLDDHRRISGQLEHMSISGQNFLNEKPLWTAIIFRKHNVRKVQLAFENWYHNVLRYSRRDQLSVNKSLSVLGKKLLRFDLDNHNSEFHIWPVKNNRIDNFEQFKIIKEQDENYGSLNKENLELKIELTKYNDDKIEIEKKYDSLKASYDLKLDEIIVLKNKIEEINAILNGVLNSKSWKLTAPFRKFVKFIRDYTKKYYATCQNKRIIFVDKNDQRGIELIKTNGNFNPNSLKLWKELVIDFDNLIDIGANYGEMIINLDFLENKKILLLEPNPYIYKFLKKSINNSKIKAQILPYALSSKKEKIFLDINLTWSGMSGISGIERNVVGHRIKKINVNTLTFEDLFNYFKLNSRVAIKIDIEGLEYVIIKDSLSFLQSKKDYALMIEVLHMNESEIIWFFRNFKVGILNLESYKIEIQVEQDELLSKLKSGKYYNQDFILYPK